MHAILVIVDLAVTYFDVLGGFHSIEHIAHTLKVSY